MILQIRHQTIYRYARPVKFGPHRLVIRPLEGHDVQIRSSGLTLAPAHRIRWVHDVFDNSIALVDFLEPSQEMNVISTVKVEQFNINPFDFILDASAMELPFSYSPEETKDVAVYSDMQYPQDRAAIQGWIKPFLNLQGRARTLDFLSSINKSFPLFFQYTRREEPGVQSPAETLRKRAGSCRDFALLLMEAARHLGLAARFVSGYLCHLETEAPPDAASHATHAWTEIYLPGAGWKGFDPTSGILAADLHVRVAVTRTPSQAVPVMGTFSGSSRDFLGMTVTVDARAMKESAPPVKPEA